MKRLIPLLAGISLAGCSKPLLVVDNSTPFSVVHFRNNSGLHLQQFYFGDPVNCKDPYLIDHSVSPYAQREHRIPSGKVVTIWTSAFGAGFGTATWCTAHAFSTVLQNGHRYEVAFEIDAQKKLCGTWLASTSGAQVQRVNRDVKGPTIGGGGPLAPGGDFSCKPTEELDRLLR